MEIFISKLAKYKFISVWCSAKILQNWNNDLEVREDNVQQGKRSVSELLYICLTLDAVL